MTYFCPYCNKFYIRKSYYDKHLKNICSSNKKGKNVLKQLKEEENPIENISLKKNKNILDVIEKIIEEESIDEKLKKLELKLEKKFEERLKEEIEKLKNYSIPSFIKEEEEEKPKETKETENKIKSIKKIKLEFPENFIKPYLNSKSIESDSELLFHIYLEGISKELVPIKKIKKNEVSFWNGDEWIIDVNFRNLGDILCSNLKKLYTKVNKLENNSDSTDYLSNQEHINELTQKKYQNQLINYFLEKYC